jgi:dual specificity phosphatase 12
MDQVIPNLWIGDLPSALDVDVLKEKNIYSIVSAMRGRVTLHDVSQMFYLLIHDTDDRGSGFQ